MVLDSGNIHVISDESFCTQSQIMLGKFPNFWQNLHAFVRGWQDDKNTIGMSRPGGL